MKKIKLAGYIITLETKSGSFGLKVWVSIYRSKEKMPLLGTNFGTALEAEKWATGKINSLINGENLLTL